MEEFREGKMIGLRVGNVGPDASSATDNSCLNSRIVVLN